jgi:hypothetical protein
MLDNIQKPGLVSVFNTVHRAAAFPVLMLSSATGSMRHSAAGPELVGADQLEVSLTAGSSLLPPHKPAVPPFICSPAFCLLLPACDSYRSPFVFCVKHGSLRRAAIFLPPPIKNALIKIVRDC